jgi:hypothetical protein
MLVLDAVSLAEDGFLGGGNRQAVAASKVLGGGFYTHELNCGRQCN